MTPALTRDGDALIWTWPDQAIAIGFDQIRESSDGLKAEISVQSLDGVEGGRRGHFHWAHFNLSSTRSRTELSNVLTKRNSAFDWPTLLEVACVRTAEEWRRGEPVVDLSAIDAPETDSYLVEKLLPEGETTVIFADGGSGKSIFALAVGIAVRTGTALPNGLRPHKQGNVLYLDWETNAREQAKRIRWLSKGLGIAPPTILYRPMYRALADDISRIRQEVTRHAVELVIVDSIGPACGGEPENAETILRVFNAMRSLSPASRQVISHVSRAGAEQKNGAARPFGSAFVSNMARSVWELRRSGEGTDSGISVALYHRKTNAGRLQPPMGFEILFDERDRSTVIQGQDMTDDPELAAHASLSWRVRQALKKGAKTTAQLSDDLDVTEATLRKVLQRMPDAGRLNGAGGRGNAATWGLREKGAGIPF